MGTVVENRRANLTAIRSTRFTSNAEMARELKKSPQQLGATLAGSKSFGDKLARELEEKLGLPVGWMDEAHAAVPKESELTTANVNNSGRRIPVLSFVRAGCLTAGDIDLSGEETIVVDPSLPEETYALRVEGDSMSPLLNRGDVLVVDPTRAPRPGNLVIARRAEGTECESTVKRYAVIGYDDYGTEIFELRPINPYYPVIRSDKINVEIVGVVVQRRSDLI